ncbi:hypothetical protein RYX36_002924 [Vicia faba]
MIHHFPFPFQQPLMPLTQNLFPIPFPLKQQQRLNCPFNDCSVPLLYNGFEIVTHAECSNCHRRFCAQCKVPWHSEHNCQQFQQTQLNLRCGISVKRKYPFEERDRCMRKHKATTCLMDCPNQQCCLELKLEENLMHSSIVGRQEYSCPFKDCSALMVNDGNELVTIAQCPSCHTVFCAQCKVPCHGGINCHQFQHQQNIQNFNQEKKEKGKTAAIEFETSNESSPQLPKSFCGICYDFIPESDIVRGSATCNHPFCVNCISNHVAAQLSQNIMDFTCPNSSCFQGLKPNHLQHILPDQVVVRWAFERFSIAK